MSRYRVLSHTATWCTTGLCDHQRGQDANVQIRTLMFPLNWTPFIQQLQSSSANQLGREELSRDNAIAFSGRKQEISQMLQFSNGDMRGERANRVSNHPFPKHIRVSHWGLSDL